VADEAFIAAPETDHLYSGDRRNPDHGANGSVHPGSVAAGGENCDSAGARAGQVGRFVIAVHGIGERRARRSTIETTERDRQSQPEPEQRWCERCWSGQPRGLHAFERSPGSFRGVADGGAVAVCRHSVVVDGGDFVAERLVGAPHVDLGHGVIGAGRERILVVAQRLGEVAGGKSVAAALAGSRLHTFIASARTRRRDAGCVALILIRLEGFDLLLLVLELLLLLLNQPLGGVDLIAHASRTDEREDAERERQPDSRWRVCHGYGNYAGAGFMSHRHQYWRIAAPCQCRSARRARP